jgi:hypothetical protein
MATTLEAILGAVHLDGGDTALTAVMQRLGLTHELLTQAVTLISPFSPAPHQRYTYPLTCDQSRFIFYAHSGVELILDLLRPRISGPRSPPTDILIHRIYPHSQR